MVLTLKISKIEPSGVEFHFSRSFNDFIITNEKVLAILIFHPVAMPAASRHVFFTKTAVDLFCLQWRGTCRNHFNVRIKMASTFFFYQENSQKIIAKWRRGSKGSIIDIFDASSTKNDELLSKLFFRTLFTTK